MALAACAALLVCACDPALPLLPAQKAKGQVILQDSGSPAGDTGYWPSLTVDRNNMPHLSFCDVGAGDLRYATPKAGRWRAFTVVQEGAVGKYTAIGVDRRGRVRIAYYDQDRKELRLATLLADDDPLPSTAAFEPALQGFITEPVAWGIEAGMACELLLGHDDAPHLFYYLPNGTLRHSYKSAEAVTGPAWQHESIDEATGGFSARIAPVLTAGPNGEALTVSYVDWDFADCELRLARHGGVPSDAPGAGASSSPPELAPAATWQHETVATKGCVGWRSKLVLTERAPFVVYSQAHNNALRLAERGPQGWRSRRLFDYIGNFAAASPPAPDAGTLLIAYEDMEHGSPGRGMLRLLRLNLDAGLDQITVPASRFSLDTDGPTGSHVALAVGRTGEVWCAYYAKAVRGVRVFEGHWRDL